MDRRTSSLMVGAMLRLFTFLAKRMGADKLKELPLFPMPLIRIPSSSAVVVEDTIKSQAKLMRTQATPPKTAPLMLLIFTVFPFMRWGQRMREFLKTSHVPRKQ